MSAWSVRRRIAAALVAGLALTLTPAVSLSASASIPQDPLPPSGARVDTSVPQVPGQIAIAWDASPTPGVEQYRIRYRKLGSLQPINGYSAGDDLTFTIPDHHPGGTLDVEVQALRNEVWSYPSFLRVTGLDDAAPNYRFTDTPDNTFTYEISWLSSTGITTGYLNPDDTRSFGPSAPVLREQMAAFLYRLAEPRFLEPYVAPAVSPFADVPTTATFYTEIAWLSAQGISTGYTEPDGTTTFRPSQPVLREQFAAFLYRFGRSTYVADFRPFEDVPVGATFFQQTAWMAAEQISTGYVDANGRRTFRGSQPVLREQTAAFLYRYVNGRFGGNQQGGWLPPSSD